MVAPSSFILPLLLAVSSFSSPVENSRTMFPRDVRAFPYSVSFVRLLNPDNSLSPYYSGGGDDLSQMIDAFNTGRGYNRERRSMESPVKRYACRFKFCRIFDA